LAAAAAAAMAAAAFAWRRTNSTLDLVGCCDAIVQQHATLDGRAITAILKPAGECIE